MRLLLQPVAPSTPARNFLSKRLLGELIPHLVANFPGVVAELSDRYVSREIPD